MNLLDERAPAHAERRRGRGSRRAASGRGAGRASRTPAKGLDAEARERDVRALLARRSGSRSSRGAGLGLAIARGLVEAHGGRIWAENRAGGGARVSFTLPAA